MRVEHGKLKFQDIDFAKHNSGCAYWAINVNPRHDTYFVEAHMAHAFVAPMSSAVLNSVTPRASGRALAYS